MSQKLFIERLVTGNVLLPTIEMLSNLECRFCGIHLAFTQLLLAHRLDYFRDFTFNSEHTYCTLTPVKWGWLLLHFISIPVRPLASFYITVALHTFSFFILPEYSFIAEETFQIQNISIVLLHIQCSQSHLAACDIKHP